MRRRCKTVFVLAAALISLTGCAGGPGAVPDRDNNLQVTEVTVNGVEITCVAFAGGVSCDWAGNTRTPGGR